MSAKKKAVNLTVQIDQPSGAGFSVYIGPTIPALIQQGTIYPVSRDEAIATMQKAVDQYPQIKSLIVSGDTLASDRVKINTPGNKLYVDYHALASGK